MMLNMCKWAFLLGVVGVLSACSFSGQNHAPIEVISSQSVGQVSQVITPIKPPPPALNAEFAGKPGYYKVQAGDTLYAIARKYQQSVDNLVVWNKLSDPNVIEVNDVLRVQSPNTVSQGVGIAGSNTVESSSESKVSIAQNKPQQPPPDVEADIKQAPVWAWPAAGKVIQVFEENPKNENQIRGLDIENVLGTPVFAAADGVVAVAQVHRGYGPLVVIRHRDNFVSAYAHNQIMLVKENDAVKKGQKIATMGTADTDTPKLFFQMRKESKPVDPLLYLPQQ